MSKVNMGTLASTQNTFSVLLDSTYHVMALIINCGKLQIATVVPQFLTVAICYGSKTTSQIGVNSGRGYTPEHSKHVHIDIAPF